MRGQLVWGRPGRRHGNSVHAAWKACTLAEPEGQEKAGGSGRVLKTPPHHAPTLCLHTMSHTTSGYTPASTP
eukprot:115751-Chlamydomonas_euryale.AAC.3